MARKQAEEWYKWFYQNWRRSERIRGMSFTAKGIYRELLDLQFDSDEGDLPESTEALRRLLGADMREWKTFLPYLEEFFPAHNGRRCNPKMAEVREERDATREMRREFAVRGGVAKAKAKGTPKGMPNAVPYALPNGVLEEKRREEKKPIGNSNIARAPSTPDASDHDSDGFDAPVGADGRKLTKEELRELRS